MLSADISFTLIYVYTCTIMRFISSFLNLFYFILFYVYVMQYCLKPMNVFADPDEGFPIKPKRRQKNTSKNWRGLLFYQDYITTLYSSPPGCMSVRHIFMKRVLMYFFYRPSGLTPLLPPKYGATSSTWRGGSKN